MDNSQLVLDYLKKYKRLFSDEIFVSCDGFGNESRKDLKHAKYVLNQYETLISNCQNCQLSEFRKIWFWFWRSRSRFSAGWRSSRIR